MTVSFQDAKSACSQFEKLTGPYKVLSIDGKDEFFRQDCVEKYIGRWRGGGFEISMKEAQEIAFTSMTLFSSSLFSQKTLWVISSLTSLRGKTKTLFHDAIRQASLDHFFLLQDEAIPKEFLELSDATVHIPSGKPWEKEKTIADWIVHYCQREKKTIDQRAALKLASGFSDSMLMLEGELKKLFLYTDGKSGITSQDVDDVCVVEVSATYWQLLDALVMGDMKSFASAYVKIEDLSGIALLRFMKKELEKLVIQLEQNAPPRNKMHARQLDEANKRGIKTLASWVGMCEMEEVSIRSGLSQEGDLLFFFLKLCM